MTKVKEQIEQIISKRRRERLPVIENELKFVGALQQNIDGLDALMAEIHGQCEMKKGPYYSMLANDPSMELRLQNVSTVDARSAIAELKKELVRLQTRFSRSSISLQVFGMAGSGKSTFIQSVTGLGNDVVLAAEGNHCTGVSSFIYNSDHFETQVYLYTEDEMLALFNKNLEALERKYNSSAQPVLLKRFTDICEFRMENVGLPADMASRQMVTKYVEHYALIYNLINGLDKVGNPIPNVHQTPDGHKYVALSSSADVQQWVAQHNGHHTSEADYKAYWNYLAVDHVDIYKQFQCEDAGNIVLMDNVGLGDAASDVSTEQHMYQAIADNSDAVILLYQPKPNSGWRGEEESINERLSNIRFKNAYTKEERMDVHELYFLLNKRQTSGFDNVRDCSEVRKAFQEAPLERKETILIANAADPQSTRQDAIEPILAQLMEHLDSIDARMTETVNQIGLKAYTVYKLLTDAVAKVVSGSMKQGSSELRKFRELYKSDLTYSHKLKELDNEYLSKKNRPCQEVKDSIEKVIASLTKFVEKPSVIVFDVAEGKKACNDILEKYCKILLNRIYAAFKDVSLNVLLPLQNEVKDRIVRILFENARLGEIPLQEYAKEDGPSQQWLSCFIKEKVDYESFPLLYETLHYILDYELSIEGLLEYNVANCLDTLDKHSERFIPISQLQGPDEVQAKRIWSEIVNRISAIQIEMRKWRDEFSLIPSHSFYARISTFRDKLVDDADTDISDELYNFYSENRMSVWRDEFASMVAEAEAFGSWNEMSGALTELCKKNAFHVQVN